MCSWPDQKKKRKRSGPNRNIVSPEMKNNHPLRHSSYCKSRMTSTSWSIKVFQNVLSKNRKAKTRLLQIHFRPRSLAVRWPEPSGPQGARWQVTQQFCYYVTRYIRIHFSCTLRNVKLIHRFVKHKIIFARAIST